MSNPLDTLNPGQRMMQLITGIWTTQIVYGAARYSLADHLRDRALTAQEIADAEGLDRRSTLRFL
jgi:hypothetical protein